MHYRASLQLVVQRGQHGLHDPWDAGHYEDVVDAESLGAAGRVVDERGTVRNACHTHACLHDVWRCGATLDHGLDFWRDDQLHAERGSYAICGDVVVGRTDATGREHVVVAVAQLVNSIDYLVEQVCDHPCLAHLYSPVAQDLCEVIEVNVLSTARENFIADDQYSGSDSLVALFHGSAC